MAVEIAAAYISIIPETSKIAPGINKAMGGAEKSASKSGESMGQKLSSGMGSALKKSAVGVGVAAGAAIGAGLTKGVGRLNGIEQAEAKLRGLGHSASSVGSIMDNALASVKGTSFGLEEAATAAAGAVAAGIKPGQELERTLKVVGDTATIAGASMGEMGQIFNSVAARGKLQGDDMMQLLSRGVPVLQLLGEELGKTSAEISDMVSKGQIDFATFQNAMERGMGGAALEAGNTVQGAMRNMGAAAGRLGATISGPFFNQAAGGFKGVTDALDAMNARAKPVMETFDAYLTSNVVPGLQNLASSAVDAFQAFMHSATVARTTEVFRQLWEAGKGLAPSLVSIGTSAAQAAGALGVGTWNLFLTALQTTAVAAKALTPPLEAISSFMESHPAAVTAAVAAWAGFKTLPGVVGKVTDAVTKQKTAMSESRSSMQQGVKDIQAYYRASGQEITKFEAQLQYLGTSSNVAIQSMARGYERGSVSLLKMAKAHKTAAVEARINAMWSKDAFTTIDYMAQSVGHTAAASLQRFGSVAGGVAGAGLQTMKAGAKGIINLFGGPWGAALAAGTAVVTTLIAETQKYNRFQDESARSATLASSAFRDMFSAMASGGDVVAAMGSSVQDVQSHLEQLASNGPGWMSRVGIAINEAGHNIGKAMGTISQETKFADEQWRDSSDSAGRAAEAIKRLGLSNEELAQQLTGSSAQFEAFKRKLIESGEGGAEAAAQMQKLRDEYNRAQGSLDRVGPAAANAAATIEELAGKTGDAGDRANKLNRAFMELAGVELSAADASAELTKVVDQVSGKMETFAGATMKANGLLDTTTQAGAAAHNELQTLGDTMRNSVGAGNDIKDVWAQSSGVLANLQQSLGMTDVEFQKLLKAYGMTPEQIQTIVDVQADEAKTQLASVAKSFAGLDGKSLETRLIVSDEGARKKLEDFGMKVKVVDEQTGEVTITAKDEQAVARYDWWVNHGMPDMDGKTAQMDAFLNTDQVKVSSEEARSILDQLDVSTTNPTAHLIMDEFRRDGEIARGDLEWLSTMSANPKVDLDTILLDTKTGTVNTTIDNLNGKTARPKADLDAMPLFATNEFAIAQLATLDLKRPMPWASMNIDSLNAQQIDALNKVGLLDGQRPTPAANLNIEDLTAEQQIALAQIFDLDSKRPTPLADLTKDQLDVKVEDAKRRLQELNDKKTEPKVSAETRAAIEKLGGVKDLLGKLVSKTIFIDVFRRDHKSGNRHGGRFARGGRYPRFAHGGTYRDALSTKDRPHDGYRLPTAGPGTNEVDGFLAYDSYGMPAARLDAGEWIINRRSSAKYDKELQQINNGTFPKLPGYADGGVFDDIIHAETPPTAQEYRALVDGKMVRGVQAERPLDGAPYENFPNRRGAWGDCSYTQGILAAFGLGMDPWPRKFSTSTQLAWLQQHGANIGIGPAGSFRMGWYDNGGGQFGHTSGTLPDGTNVEMGGGPGGGKVGPAAAGFNHPQYTHHAWIPAGSGTTAASTSPDSPVETDAASDTAPGADGSDELAPSATASSFESDPDVAPLSPAASASADSLQATPPGGDSLSGYAGSVVAAFVSGHIGDALQIAGFPDQIPPIFKLGSVWFQAVNGGAEKLLNYRKNDDAVVEAGKTAEALPEGQQAAPGADGSVIDEGSLEEAVDSAVESPDVQGEEAEQPEEKLSGVDAVKAAVKKSLKAFGWDTGEQFDSIDFIVEHESNWDPNAVNPSSGAFGLFQLNPASGTLQQYLPDRSPDPEKQGEAGARYIQDRYGTPVAAAEFWRANNWYDSGGRATGVGHMLKNTIKPERVLSPEQTKAFEDLVYNQIPAMQDTQPQGQPPQPAEQPQDAATVTGQEPEKTQPEQATGSLENMVNEALPMVMAQNSWADAAKLVTSSAVSFAGNMATSAASGLTDSVFSAGMSALGMAGTPTIGALVGSATAPVTGALGPAGGAAAGMAAAPLGAMLGQVMPMTPGDVVGTAGGAMTDLAAWYSGEVAWGVTNAFEEYSKDIFGSVLLPFQDMKQIVENPVGYMAQQTGLEAPLAIAQEHLGPAMSAVSPDGAAVVNNFIANDTDGIFAKYRVEQAKASAGKIGVH